MATHLRRSIEEQITKYWLSFEERWRGPDRGLIVSWECGRLMRDQEPQLAARADGGELVPLPWKGSPERVKTPEGLSERRGLVCQRRFGCLEYLAMWQGLRNQDLNIVVDGEQTVRCTRTDIQVTFVENMPGVGEEAGVEATTADLASEGR
jgi:hypothetical protein